MEASATPDGALLNGRLWMKSSLVKVQTDMITLCMIGELASQPVKSALLLGVQHDDLEAA